MMKTIKLILSLFLILGFQSVDAQISDKDLNYLLVRQDDVKPSQAAAYETSLLELKQFLGNNNVKHVNYMTQVQDNNFYSHVTPLIDLNDIEGGLKTFVIGDQKSAEFDVIWSYLNSAIESVKYYVVKYEPELSYVTDGNVWLEEAPYRRWNYLYFEPGTEKEAEKLLLAYKNLYKNKGVKSGFRVFRAVIGLDQPVVMFTTWSKSPLDYQMELQESIDLLGDEGTVLWLAMMDLVSATETIEGWYLPQYSFMPMAQKK
ncbi:hypothetical protein [Gelidibacter japonicus]|uniref:hypothetical protein n=1 Tax=Gelidibacter japonicus TaxID=1962232 RepID=UPI0013D54331|nr:hypothetical protein [Gelidibacter japonicus]